MLSKSGLPYLKLSFHASLWRFNACTLIKLANISAPSCVKLHDEKLILFKLFELCISLQITNDNNNNNKFLKIIKDLI